MYKRPEKQALNVATELEGSLRETTARTKLQRHFCVFRHQECQQSSLSVEAC